MQLLVLALVLGLFLHQPQTPPAHPWRFWVVLLSAKVLVGAAYWGYCRLTRWQMGRRRGPYFLNWGERVGAAFRFAALALYAADLSLGALDSIRQGLTGWTGSSDGDLILIDEVLMIAPTLALIAWGWWAYYPVDRRLREATLLGRLDAGLPIYSIWTRRQFLLTQFRHHVAIILAPVLILLAWEELLGTRWAERHLPHIGVDLRPALLLAGVGCVFLFAPAMIRRIWDTTPLPPGELRERLLAMCRQHGVGVRELLLWRTFGGMINGAVMGIIAPLRYILLTDALLEMLPGRQVEAVMAHELAHVRRHHMFWLLVTAATLMTGLERLWYYAAYLPLNALVEAMHNDGLVIGQYVIHVPPRVAEWVLWLGKQQVVLDVDADRASRVELVALGGALLSWVLLFGWVSRRFERQADTFAVQHLARQAARELPAEGAAAALPEPPERAPVVDAESVMVMTDALQRVADLNSISVKRRSWRHGSILRRQNYLRGLIGRRVNQLPIDRQVRGIELATLGVLALIVVLCVVAPSWWR